MDDPDDNHVGVDINSLISVKTETAGYWNGEEFQEFSLKSGRNIQAWIDYDHLQSQLNVTITLAGLPRPQKPLISQKIDLQSVLQEKMFVGFSAATGNFIRRPLRSRVELHHRRHGTPPRYLASPFVC
jgi:hypothetical protein